jgi:hypothetical protein
MPWHQTTKNKKTMNKASKAIWFCTPSWDIHGFSLLLAGFPKCPLAMSTLPNIASANSHDNLTTLNEIGVVSGANGLLSLWWKKEAISNLRF